MKRMVAVILTLVLVLTAVPALAEVNVTDQAGREVTLQAPAQNIVSCYYMSTASLLALGLADRLTGIEMKADTRMLYQLAASEIIGLPAVGSGKGINIETIAALAPDCVILPKKLKDEAALLEQLAIPVVIVDPETQADFEACVTLLGEVAGVADVADTLLARYHTMTENVRAMTEDLAHPSVYMSSGSDFLTTFPAGLYQNDLITIAGGTNVAGELAGEGKAVIDAEQLLAWNPEYIFIVADADYTVEDIRNDSRFAALTAVQNDHVYAFPSDIEAWDYPTPSSVLGQLYMASILHPEIISGEDFLAEAAAFYRDVFGIEITKENLGI